MQAMETQKIIQKAGGARKVAEGLGLSTQAVYGWDKIPAVHLHRMAKMSGVAPEKIRPDMF